MHLTTFMQLTTLVQVTTLMELTTLMYVYGSSDRTHVLATLLLLERIGTYISIEGSMYERQL